MIVQVHKAQGMSSPDGHIAVEQGSRSRSSFHVIDLSIWEALGGVIACVRNRELVNKKSLLDPRARENVRISPCFIHKEICQILH